MSLLQLHISIEQAELDEEMVAALVRNPEALQMIKEYLKRKQQPPKPKKSSPPVRYTARYRPNRRNPVKPIVPRKPDNIDRIDNPMLKSGASNRMEFFGPSDYKPERPYHLPGLQRSQEQQQQSSVYPWQVGYIPIPR